MITQVLQKGELLYTVKPLDVGDAWITDDTDNLLACIERKTVSDLWSSFRSNRYSDQKKRMLELKERVGCDLHYIIEGSCNTSQIPQMTGCCISLQDAGFKVIHSTGVYQTVDILQYLHKRYNTTEKPKSAHVPNAVHALKLRPSDTLTPENWWLHSLSLIPNMSIEKAKRIVEKYPTIEDLMECLKTKPISEIADIRCGGTQNRRLGDQLAKKIHTHILFHYSL